LLALPPLPPLLLLLDEQATSAKARLPTSMARGARARVGEVGFTSPRFCREARNLVENMGVPPGDGEEAGVYTAGVCSEFLKWWVD
jgi:hypothetical protein